nr:uncharacterized protein LOC109193148 isoform X2 [Ipomoea batatas]
MVLDMVSAYRNLGKKAKVSRRNYVASQIGSSDDDFVSPPLVGLGTMQEGPELNAPDGVKGGEDESRFPKVKTRSPAVVLVDALKDLSCQQKDDIRDMGFGSLLEFNVGDSPPCLVHWLLSNFDGQARAFDLGGGRLLPLEERDVELVLGFPRGCIEMVKRDKLHISNLLQHWRGKFEKKRHHVTPSEIATHMVKRVDGGILFRRHFCMLVLNTLVGCMRNGYANQMYFQCFDDVRRIRDLNWCKLLVDSLVETQAAWKSGRHKCFVGSAEFVALFYVDRVMHLGRPIPRLVPSFRGWTKELLLERELSEIRTGGFGMGVIEPPIVDGGHVDGGGDTPTGADDGCGDCSTPTRACEYGPKTFADVVAEKTTALARSILELSELFKHAREGDLDGEVCRQMHDAIQLLVGVTQQPSCPNFGGGQPTQQTFTQRDDVFWSNADNLRAVDDIERAIIERNQFKDIPSFSLGLTQDFNEAVRVVVDDVTREYPSPGCDRSDFGTPPEGVGVDQPSVTPCKEKDETPSGFVVTGLDVDGGPDSPEFVTPPEESIHRNERCDPSRSDGLGCRAPVKVGRALRPPPAAGRGLDCIDDGSGGPSEPVLDVLNDLPEEAVVNWLLSGGGADMEDIVFAIGERIARWDDILTLVPGSLVWVAVIDAWSALLNRRELTKSPDAPSRFFASTFTTIHTIVDGSYDRDLRVGWFRERLLLDFESSPYGDFKEVDLMFFPFIRSEHYFLLCFDFRRYRFEIIDNSSSSKPKKDKYGECLIDMQDMLFCCYVLFHRMLHTSLISFALLNGFFLVAFETFSTAFVMSKLWWFYAYLSSCSRAHYGFYGGFGSG